MIFTVDILKFHIQITKAFLFYLVKATNLFHKISFQHVTSKMTVGLSKFTLLFKRARIQLILT